MSQSPAENDQKKQLRTRIRKRLASMTAAERHDKSLSVCRRISALEAFDRARTVMMYMPLPEEVDVTPLAIACFQRGKTVCVPKVDWQKRDMAPVEVRSFDDACMDLDEHGIRVPRDGRIVLPDIIDLIIIPGLAFDTSGNRLGRGAGYYDRFLAKLHPRSVKLGAGYDEQIVESVPVSARDVCVDVVVTDRRMNRAPRHRANRRR